MGFLPFHRVLPSFNAGRPHRPARFVRGGVSQRSHSRGTMVDCGGLTTKWRSMDENRVEGTARNLGGKVQEGFGRLRATRERRLRG